jgi:hypothetical protein
LQTQRWSGFRRNRYYVRGRMFWSRRSWSMLNVGGGGGGGGGKRDQGWAKTKPETAGNKFRIRRKRGRSSSNSSSSSKQQRRPTTPTPLEDTQK